MTAYVNAFDGLAHVLVRIIRRCMANESRACHESMEKKKSCAQGLLGGGKGEGEQRVVGGPVESSAILQVKIVGGGEREHSHRKVWTTE